MKSRFRIAWTLAIIASLGGCTNTISPASPPDARSTHEVVTLHGVLVVPAENATGVQGRAEAWFLDDDGVAYDLALPSPLEFLDDPDHNGRSLTITGELVFLENVAIGANPRMLAVSDVRFDEP
jgi:hypothetical protein